jgi:hypothetical protein
VNPRWGITTNPTEVGEAESECRFHDACGEVTLGCINQLIMSVKELLNTSHGKQVAAMILVARCKLDFVKGNTREINTALSY